MAMVICDCYSSSGRHPHLALSDKNDYNFCKYCGTAYRMRRSELSKFTI